MTHVRDLTLIKCVTQYLLCPQLINTSNLHHFRAQVHLKVGYYPVLWLFEQKLWLFMVICWLISGSSSSEVEGCVPGGGLELAGGGGVSAVSAAGCHGRGFKCQRWRGMWLPFGLTSCMPRDWQHEAGVWCSWSRPQSSHLLPFIMRLLA